MRNVSKIIDGKRVIIKKPELLAPAGTLEKLKIAVIYGADAVFIGGKAFSLRSGASNFSLEDIKEAVDFATPYGTKIHVTTNIIFHNENIDGLEEYLTALDDIGVYAVIAADPYVLATAKKLNLRLEVHLSTQMSVENSSAVNFFKDMGFDRVVLGREVSYDELTKIVNKSDIEIEYFIHGAMCIHYSGRCMLSNHFSKRDANRGGCNQSCRWYYDMYQGDVNLTKTHQLTPFSMSSKDMALVDHIEKLIELGVDSFKIEGRMKSIHYIATVVSTYRKLIDRYCEDPDHFDASNFYQEELAKAANRETAEGFFLSSPKVDSQLFKMRNEHPTQDFVIQVIDFDPEQMIAKIHQRNYFKLGDTVEFFGPQTNNIQMTIESIWNEKMEAIDVARHPMEVLYIKVSHPLKIHDMARLVRRNN